MKRTIAILATLASWFGLLALSSAMAAGPYSVEVPSGTTPVFIQMDNYRGGGVELSQFKFPDADITISFWAVERDGMFWIWRRINGNDRSQGDDGGGPARYADADSVATVFAGDICSSDFQADAVYIQRRGTTAGVVHWFKPGSGK